MVIMIRKGKDGKEMSIVLIVVSIKSARIFWRKCWERIIEVLHSMPMAMIFMNFDGCL